MACRVIIHAIVSSVGKPLLAFLTLKGCRNVTPGLLMQEMLSESSAPAQSQGRDLDVDDLLDDPELERLHAERLAVMQREAEKRVQLQRKGHGELQEVTCER